MLNASVKPRSEQTTRTLNHGERKTRERFVLEVRLRLLQAVVNSGLYKPIRIAAISHGTQEFLTTNRCAVRASSLSLLKFTIQTRYQASRGTATRNDMLTLLSRREERKLLSLSTMLRNDAALDIESKTFKSSYREYLPTSRT